MRSIKTILFIILIASITVSWAQVQRNDDVYGAKIKEYTTDDRFISDLVDYLPLSEDVPSPLEHFGTIIGAPMILHHTDEIAGYMQLLAEKSPRVTLRDIGKTEEGRNMYEVIITSESNMADLEMYRNYLDELSDPRGLNDEQAKDIIAKAKPIYLALSGLHSPETGGPEMLMEAAYRLAVDESPMIRNIRDNLITIIIPVAEPDGRDRMVDTYNYRKDHNDVGPSLVYWGKYVAHDNNRDGFGLALALTRNILGSFLHWKPIVGHDFHESVPYLYASTGTGPYNVHIDPITIDEWHNLAFEDVTQLTKRGMVGVWTHGFYNGWASNYLLWVPILRNAVGRFYETFGNSIADTKERKLRSRNTSTKWYRASPPLEKTMWSLRNHVNFAQSGFLISLNYTAKNGTDMVENFYIKSRNAVNKGKNEAPYAWVIPHNQTRRLGAADLVNLLLDEGVEVHRASSNLKWTSTTGKGKKEKKTNHTAPKGSYIVRMDQPYRAVIMNLLDEQIFPKDEDPPYDDTGWTLPHLRQVTTHKVDDPAIQKAKMKMITSHVKIAGGIKGKGKYFVLNNTTDDNFTVFRFKLGDVKVNAAEAAFKVGKINFKAGSFIIEAQGNAASSIESAVKELGLNIIRTNKKPKVKTHAVEIPRVALVHTWVATPQDAGWWQLAFDRIGIPYTYMSEQEFATVDLNQFDVIILPRSRANPTTLVAGRPLIGEPIPWKKDPKYPALGHIDETDDMRKGMGFEGVANLKRFVENGGVFITEGTTAAFPIDMGITRRISIRRTSKLQVRGSVLRTKFDDLASPITYGYADTLAVYFNQAPVFRINKTLGNYRTPEWIKDETWQKEVPRVVLSFAKKNILLSGMLKGESELSGTPAVVDVPVGKGHVVLFANRPFWRWETHGSHALVFNTMLHWNDLRTGWPERPDEDEDEDERGLHEIWNEQNGFGQQQ